MSRRVKNAIAIIFITIFLVFGVFFLYAQSSQISIPPPSEMPFDGL